MIRNALTLAAFLLASLAAIAEPPVKPPMEIGPPVADIPVVHTGKELLKLEPISDNDTQFLAGIEASACDLGGGALVYVVFPKPPKEFRTTDVTAENQSQLGPFILEVEPQEKSARRHMMIEAVRDVQHRAANENQLFVGAIQPPRAGKYFVRIKNRDGAVLAKTEFTVGEKPAHPWLPLDALDSSRQNAGREIACKIGPRPICPNWDGIVFTAEFPKGDLPTLFPSAESPDFKIKAADGIVEITGNGLPPYVNDYYMARLWINDKPVTLEETALEKQALDQRGEMRRNEPVTLKLYINFSQLKAKEGDTVTMQIAYCPAGTKRVRTGEQDGFRRELEMMRAVSDAPMLLTKKVSFKLTKESVTRPARAQSREETDEPAEEEGAVENQKQEAAPE